MFGLKISVRVQTSRQGPPCPRTISATLIGSTWKVRKLMKDKPGTREVAVQSEVGGATEEEIVIVRCPFIQHILPLLVKFTAKRGHFRGDGEKLGFGLRFEGGGRATECVRRLFIQVNKPTNFLFFCIVCSTIKL